MTVKDESLGIEIAEDKEEKAWLEIKESSEKDIVQLKKLLMFQEAVVEMAKEKLKKYAKT
jgi:hypothetical protein